MLRPLPVRSVDRLLPIPLDSQLFPTREVYFSVPPDPIRRESATMLNVIQRRRHFSFVMTMAFGVRQRCSVPRMRFSNSNANAKSLMSGIDRKGKSPVSLAKFTTGDQDFIEHHRPCLCFFMTCFDGIWGRCNNSYLESSVLQPVPRLSIPNLLSTRVIRRGRQKATEATSSRTSCTVTTASAILSKGHPLMSTVASTTAILRFPENKSFSLHRQDIGGVVW